MRSFENVVRVGRFRAPSTALTPALRIGEGVMLDSANPGLFKRATAGVAADATCGIVVYEHIQNKSDALTLEYDDPYDKVPVGVYAQVMRGPGVKVWLKNTAAKTLYDGRVRSAFDFVLAADLAAAVPGTGLSPNGSGIWVVDSTVPWLVVEQVNTTTKVVEARFTF
jgi:hypothetical protein